MQATFARLQSGAWGVRTRGATPAVGAVLTVTRRDGQTTTVTVARILASNPQGALCAIERTERTTARTAPRRSAAPRQTWWQHHDAYEQQQAQQQQQQQAPAGWTTIETSVPADDLATGDARRCERHGYTTSSPDGLHDTPCPACEAEHDREERTTPVPPAADDLSFDAPSFGWDEGAALDPAAASLEWQRLLTGVGAR